ncbi:MAG: LysR family transcriptional regulator [Hyphomicrobiaceae bacterium]|nr:LysR family transcriptional regulator [Hyphomicrobiaceae bacterium]
METHEIRYFVAVARELNFTRAASTCGVSQPALTRAIQKLEAELGGALLLRRPGHVELTQLGRKLLPQLEEVEQGLTDIRRKAERLVGQQASRLRLGVMCTASPTVVVELLSQLRSQHDKLDVSIVDMKASGVIDMLLDDQIDIGITAQPAYPDAVAARPVMGEDFVVAMSEAHPFARRNQVALSEVARASYLERLGCEFDDYLEVLSAAEVPEFNVAFASEREDWIQALILSGQGIAIVPQGMGCLPGIVKRPLVEPRIARTISLVTVRGRPLSALGQSFMRAASARRWGAAPGGT